MDDEPRNRELLKVMLSPEGLDVATATSGEAARSPWSLTNPDLILLDVMMSGLDGYEVTNRIKSEASTKSITSSWSRPSMITRPECSA